MVEKKIDVNHKAIIKDMQEQHVKEENEAYLNGDDSIDYKVSPAQLTIKGISDAISALMQIPDDVTAMDLAEPLAKHLEFTIRCATQYVTSGSEDDLQSEHQDIF